MSETGGEGEAAIRPNLVSGGEQGEADEERQTVRKSACREVMQRIQAALSRTKTCAAGQATITSRL